MVVLPTPPLGVGQRDDVQSTPDGFDKLGVIAQPRGVLFVRHTAAFEGRRAALLQGFGPTKIAKVRLVTCSYRLTAAIAGSQLTEGTFGFSTAVFISAKRVGPCYTTCYEEIVTGGEWKSMDIVRYREAIADYRYLLKLDQTIGIAEKSADRKSRCICNKSLIPSKLAAMYSSVGRESY
jgi:hypothetical protein